MAPTSASQQYQQIWYSHQWKYNLTKNLNLRTRSVVLVQITRCTSESVQRIYIRIWLLIQTAKSASNNILHVLSVSSPKIAAESSDAERIMISADNKISTSWSISQPRTSEMEARGLEGQQFMITIGSWTVILLYIFQDGNTLITWSNESFYVDKVSICESLFIHQLLHPEHTTQTTHDVSYIWKKLTEKNRTRVHVCMTTRSRLHD